MTFIQMGLGLEVQGRQEIQKDTQWRQVITLYTRILRTFADSAYFCELHEVTPLLFSIII